MGSYKESNGLLIAMKQNLHLPGKPLTVIVKRNPATKRLTEGIKVYSEDDLPKIA